MKRFVLITWRSRSSENELAGNPHGLIAFEANRVPKGRNLLPFVYEAGSGTVERCGWIERGEPAILIAARWVSDAQLRSGFLHSRGGLPAPFGSFDNDRSEGIEISLQ